MVFCDADEQLDYIDIITTPVILISETIKNVFSLYESGIKYKCFCILNNRTGQYGNNFAPNMNAIETIDDEGIARYLYDEREQLVVRLDVMESLLRRSVRGLTLKKMGVRKQVE